MLPVCPPFIFSSFQEWSTGGSWYSSGFRANAKSGNVGAVSMILQSRLLNHLIVVNLSFINQEWKGKNHHTRIFPVEENLPFIRVQITVYPNLAWSVFWNFLREILHGSPKWRISAPRMVSEAIQNCLLVSGRCTYFSCKKRKLKVDTRKLKTKNVSQ